MAIVDESVTAGRVSARKLQRSVKASRNTLLRRMHELGGEYLPVQRQPRALRESDKRKRVGLAGQLHKPLVAKNTWPRIITGDEAWIYLRNDSKAEWLFPWDKMSTRTETGIGDLKILLTVFWSSTGFHLIRFSPTRNQG